MPLPPQGFRHAATLLMTNRLRAIPRGASPQSIESELARLANDLVALADDTRASSEVRAWLIDEYSRTVDRIPVSFDVTSAKNHGAAILEFAGRDPRLVERRDLFLMYVPDDRLPIAAPLAIELTKRRITVAFSEYEIATPGELHHALAHGLAHHRVGVLLRTKAFDRMVGRSELQDGPRLRVLTTVQPPSTADDLVAWVQAQPRT